MKKLIKLVLPAMCLMLTFFLCHGRANALTLNEGELRLLNGISRFIDQKPEGSALRLIESAMKSQNPCLRGLAAIILFKHYGESFCGQLLRNFTLNQEKESFEAENKVLVKIENVQRLLTNFDELLKRLKDERVRQLFLFYHFRHKQVYMLGAAGEQLSMAVFYRVGLFEAIIGHEHDAIGLAEMADQ
ncbi:MAG: hypothetical protein KKB51_17965 [Candidatus Riflebacteria bacterium]|nr:hypothetical protein [Candidatus Riflebacteria bacterium]